MRYAGLPGVILPIPARWEDRTELVIVGGDGAGFRPNIVVATQSLVGMGLDEFVDHHLDGLRATMENLHLRLDEPASFGQHEGHLLEYDVDSAGEAYRQRQFIVVSQDLVHTFTYTDTATHFETGVPLMEEVVGNSVLTSRQQESDEFLK